MDINIKKFEERYSQNINYFGDQPSTLFSKTKELILQHFSKRIIDKLKIVEVGAGQGRDSIALAKLLPNSIVYCTDAAIAGIKTAQENIRNAQLSDRIITEVQDVFAKYKDDLKEADLIFASLCLHYHKDTTMPNDLLKETNMLFKNVVDSLLPNGLFVFSVVSEKDENFGKGEEIGKDMNVWKFDGRIYNFFNEKRIYSILSENKCKILLIDVCSEKYNPHTDRLLASYIVVAQKVN
jgi:SAM-dependent methyltransferase